MPSHLLCIETTTTQCSVALCADGELSTLAQSNHENYQHAQLLHTYIDKVLSKHNLKPSDLAAIALSSGPGSYTGLRIGAAAAKGLCYANDIPLIAIPTLDIVAREITPSVVISLRLLMLGETRYILQSIPTTINAYKLLSRT